VSTGVAIKYDANGAVKWCTTVVGADQVSDIAVDRSGNVFMVGYSTAATPVTVYNADGSPSVHSISSTGGAVAFLVKWSTLGVAQWSVTVDSPQNEQGFSIAVDAVGNPFLAGYFTSNNIVIYNKNNVASSVNINAAASRGAFLVKWDSEGEAQACTSVAGSQAGEARHVAVDDAGDVYMTGVYNGSVTIYNPDGTISNIPPLPTAASTVYSAYVVKFNMDPTYKLLSALDSAYDGLVKTFINKSTTPLSMQVSNSNDTQALSTLIIPANQTMAVSWHHPTWHTPNDNVPASGIIPGAFQPGMYTFQNIGASNVTVSSSLNTSNIIAPGTITANNLTASNITVSGTVSGNIAASSITTGAFRNGLYTFSNIEASNLAVLSVTSSNTWSTLRTTLSNYTFVNSNVFVGIGISNPSFPLHVVGSATNANIFTNGDITAFSDARAKTDLKVINNALDKVRQINGYTYARMEAPEGRRMAGVVAQEVEKVLPEVIYMDDKGYMSVAYANMVSLLIEAVHELERKVDALTLGV
jgi:hypothetical protein